MGSLFDPPRPKDPPAPRIEPRDDLATALRERRRLLAQRQGRSAFVFDLNVPKASEGSGLRLPNREGDA